MVLLNVVLKDKFFDSVVLMHSSGVVSSQVGVSQVSAMMGTEANRNILSEAGMLTDAGRSAGANDLIITVKAEDREKAESAIRKMEELLNAGEVHPLGDDEYMPMGLESAREILVGAELALISIPGAYVKFEATKCLEADLHVMIFSDNVPLEDEIELKRIGREKNLLVMGPDCGTSILNGIALGFANKVRRGHVGIVGGSGTGIQEVTCLLHHMGIGISQAIGTGGRDLSEGVGGLTTLTGIDLLEDDPDTELLILISKPPSPAVEEVVLERAARCSKPVLVAFLGGDMDRARRLNLATASNLEEAARMARAMLLGEEYSPVLFTEEVKTVQKKAEALRARLTRGQRFIRGLYSGGTLCDEALLELGRFIPNIYSNVAVDSRWKVRRGSRCVENCLLDLGDDEYTVGVPHPMIDFRLRCEKILEQASFPDVAVILLDVVLGYGAHPDPAGELLPVMDEARSIASREGREIFFVAHLCGTEEDPQDLGAQRQRLEEAGVVILPSNVQAARFSALMTGEGVAANWTI